MATSRRSLSFTLDQQLARRVIAVGIVFSEGEHHRSSKRNQAWVAALSCFYCFSPIVVAPHEGPAKNDWPEPSGTVSLIEAREACILIKNLIATLAFRVLVSQDPSVSCTNKQACSLSQAHFIGTRVVILGSLLGTRRIKLTGKRLHGEASCSKLAAAKVSHANPPVCS